MNGSAAGPRVKVSADGAVWCRTPVGMLCEVADPGIFRRSGVEENFRVSSAVGKGNAGSNTTADHITVLEQALAPLPAAYRPGPDNPEAPQVLIRSDSARAHLWVRRGLSGRVRGVFPGRGHRPA